MKELGETAPKNQEARSYFNREADSQLLSQLTTQDVVVITGGPGTGKTWLAERCVDNLSNNPDISSDFTKFYFLQASTEEELFHEYQELATILGVEGQESLSLENLVELIKQQIEINKQDIYLFIYDDFRLGEEAAQKLVIYKCTNTKAIITSQEALRLAQKASNTRCSLLDLSYGFHIREATELLLRSYVNPRTKDTSTLQEYRKYFKLKTTLNTDTIWIQERQYARQLADFLNCHPSAITTASISIREELSIATYHKKLEAILATRPDLTKQQAVVEILNTQQAVKESEAQQEQEPYEVTQEFTELGFYPSDQGIGTIEQGFCTHQVSQESDSQTKESPTRLEQLENSVTELSQQLQSTQKKLKTLQRAFQEEQRERIILQEAFQEEQTKRQELQEQVALTRQGKLKARFSRQNNFSVSRKRETPASPELSTPHRLATEVLKKAIMNLYRLPLDDFTCDHPIITQIAEIIKENSNLRMHLVDLGMESYQNQMASKLENIFSIESDNKSEKLLSVTSRFLPPTNIFINREYLEPNKLRDLLLTNQRVNSGLFYPWRPQTSLPETAPYLPDSPNMVACSTSPTIIPSAIYKATKPDGNTMTTTLAWWNTAGSARIPSYTLDNTTAAQTDNKSHVKN